MKVVVLGAGGMLGSMVAAVLAAGPGLEVHTTLHSETALPVGQHRLDATTATVGELEALLAGAAWAINCIGVIKPYIHDDNRVETERALQTNALFPHRLAAAAERTGCRILQIATDCVYSGKKGAYLETDPHDAWDAYGKTKSLGEVASPQVHHLRCSIIGPEQKGRLSLLEWFLGHKQGATVPGYTNHLWNGVTTLHFARLCQGILSRNLTLPGLCHVLPAAPLSKADLLGLMASAYGRTDIVIQPGPAVGPIDRTLGTSQPDVNGSLWSAAGYGEPPSLAAMIEELAAWSRASETERP